MQEAEINETATQEESPRRGKKGSGIQKGRKRESPAAEVEQSEEKSAYVPTSYGDYARYLSEQGVKNAYSEARKRRPDLYTKSMNEALEASKTVRRK
jgi:hypothetical protein